jgi:hypothetical protein
MIIPEAINFKTVKNPIIHGDNFIGKYAVDVVDDHNKIIKTIGVVGGNYQLIDHVDIISKCNYMINKITGGNFEVKHEIVDRSTIGRKIMSTYILKSDNFLIGKGQDSSFPKLVMVNSFDGSNAFKLLMGIFRMVCSNGMIVLSKEIANIQNKHFLNFNLDRATSILPQLLTDYSNEYVKFNNLALNKAPIKDDKLENLIAKQHGFSTKMLKSGLEQFKNDSTESDSAWGQYNGLTHQITRSDLSFEKKEEHTKIITSIYQNHVGMKV